MSLQDIFNGLHFRQNIALPSTPSNGDMCFFSGKLYLYQNGWTILAAGTPTGPTTVSGVSFLPVTSLPSSAAVSDLCVFSGRTYVYQSGGWTSAYECLPWDSAVTYNVGNLVRSADGKTLYVSTVASNINNNPTSSTSQWTPFIPLIQGAAWSATISYSVGSMVLSPDGKSLYVSLVASNLNNNPTTSSTQWLPIVQTGSTSSVTVGTETLNCQASAVFRKSASASASIIGLNNMCEGQTVTVMIETLAVATQAAITWKRGTTSTGIADIKWSGGVLPTPTTATYRVDRYIFQMINNVIYGSADMNCY